MTNSNGHNFEELPVVLLHGTSGQSEDWSQVVEQLTSHRSVIRPNYAEPVAGTDSGNAPIELWQRPGLVGGVALTLSAFPLERLPHSLPRSIPRGFARWFLYQVSVTAATRE